MEYSNEFLNRPLYSLSVGEYLALHPTTTPTQPDPSPAQPERIRGINGLAKFLDISPVTAQKLKNSGKIPYYQRGRLVYFEPSKVMAALANNPKKR